MRYLESCCCYFKLKTGTLIFSYLGLIFTTLSLINLTVKNLLFDGDSELSQDIDPKYNGNVEGPQDKHEAIIIANYVDIFLASVVIIAIVILIVGAHKGRHKLFIPFIVIEIFLGIIVHTLLDIAVIAMAAYRTTDSKFIDKQICMMILHLSYHGYYLYVVISYRATLIQMEAEYKNFLGGRYAAPNFEAYPVNPIHSASIIKNP